MTMTSDLDVLFRLHNATFAAAQGKDGLHR